MQATRSAMQAQSHHFVKDLHTMEDVDALIERADLTLGPGAAALDRARRKKGHKRAAVAAGSDALRGPYSQRVAHVEPAGRVPPGGAPKRARAAAFGAAPGAALPPASPGGSLPPLEGGAGRGRVGTPLAMESLDLDVARDGGDGGGGGLGPTSARSGTGTAKSAGSVSKRSAGGQSRTGGGGGRSDTKAGARRKKGGGVHHGDEEPERLGAVELEQKKALLPFLDKMLYIDSQLVKRDAMAAHEAERAAKLRAESAATDAAIAAAIGDDEGPTDDDDDDADAPNAETHGALGGSRGGSARPEHDSDGETATTSATRALRGASSSGKRRSTHEPTSRGGGFGAADDDDDDAAAGRPTDDSNDMFFALDTAEV